MTSQFKYLKQINPKSFQECLNFVDKQLEALNVPSASNNDVGTILVNWSNHLAAKSTNTYAIFKMAADGVTQQSPTQSFKRQQSLNKRLNKRPIIDFNSMSEIANAVITHPFYNEFQREGLVAANQKVASTYRGFKKIDNIVKLTERKMGDISNKLQSLEMPNLGLENLHIPTTLDNMEAVVGNLNDTANLLKNRKPEIYYSATALAALGDAAAKEIYADWCKALVIFDISLSRYYAIAYFGITLDTAVELKASTQIAGALHTATIRELNELMKLASGLLQ